MSQNLNAESDRRDRFHRKKNSALQIARVPDWISHSLPEDLYCELMEYGDRCLAKYRHKWRARVKIWRGVFGMIWAAIAIDPGNFIKRLFATYWKHRQRVGSALLIFSSLYISVVSLLMPQLQLLSLLRLMTVLLGVVLAIDSLLIHIKKTKRRTE